MGRWLAAPSRKFQPSFYFGGVLYESISKISPPYCVLRSACRTRGCTSLSHVIWFTNPIVFARSLGSSTGLGTSPITIDSLVSSPCQHTPIDGPDLLASGSCWSGMQSAISRPGVSIPWLYCALIIPSPCLIAMCGMCKRIKCGSET